MRIIGGNARGTKLYTLDGKNTRPTLDRVRESLFNIIQNDIKDCSFLDLFSGSGAIGLEAISRGARKAILCDNSVEAVKIIKKNVEKTKYNDNVEIYLLDFKTLLKDIINEKLDIVYIDPPYNTDFAYQAIQIIIEKDLLNENSMMIIETDRDEIENNINTLPIEIIDIRRYGRAKLIFVKKCE